MEKHLILREKLRKIPEERELTYREDKIEDNLIGKPRFKEKHFSWPPDLLAELKDHLQEIWHFFSKYSYYFDDTIFPIIGKDYRRTSKKSVIFLLERDVWETDEVFGDYLIEMSENTINKNQISYFRFNQKYKTFKFQNCLTFEQRENWIIENVKTQIQTQFDYLWDKVKVEISSCITQEFTKIPEELFEIDYIKEQIHIIETILEISHESALLSLGRLVEVFSLSLLNKERREYQENTFNLCLNLNLIDVKQEKLFKKINHECNQLKHTRYYHAHKDMVVHLLNQFISCIDEGNYGYRTNSTISQEF